MDGKINFFSFLSQTLFNVEIINMYNYCLIRSQIGSKQLSYVKSPDYSLPSVKPIKLTYNKIQLYSSIPEKFNNIELNIMCL